MLPIIRSETIFVRLPNAAAGGAGVFFPFNYSGTLQNVWIVSVECFTATQFANAPGPAAVLTAADALNVTLGLFDGADERYKEVPYLRLVAAVNGGVYPDLHPFMCDLQKSRAHLTANLAAANPTLAIMFGYMRPEDVPMLSKDDIRRIQVAAQQRR